jgi:hypothetical protein
LWAALRDRGRPRPSRCRAWGFVRAGSLPGSAYSDRCGRREAPVGADAPGTGQSAGHAHAATWRVLRRAGQGSPMAATVTVAPSSSVLRSTDRLTAPSPSDSGSTSPIPFVAWVDASVDEMRPVCSWKFRRSIGCVTCPGAPHLWCYAVGRGSRRLGSGRLEFRLLSTRRFRSPRPVGCAARVASAAPGRAGRAVQCRRGLPRAGRPARVGGGCLSAPG